MINKVAAQMADAALNNLDSLLKKSYAWDSESSEISNVRLILPMTSIWLSKERKPRAVSDTGFARMDVPHPT